MGQCSAQIFQSISPAQFTQLAEKGQAAGLAICGHCGTAEKSGVVITWSYDPAAQQLTIQSTHVPFYVSCNDVNQRIQQLVKDCLA